MPILVVAIAAYGANATVAKTEEELEDRHRALLGDADNADDVMVDLPTGNGNAYEDHVNGDAGTNGQAHTQNGVDGTDGSYPAKVRAHTVFSVSLQASVDAQMSGSMLFVPFKCGIVELKLHMLKLSAYLRCTLLWQIHVRCLT